LNTSHPTAPSSSAKPAAAFARRKAAWVSMTNVLPDYRAMSDRIVPVTAVTLAISGYFYRSSKVHL